MKSREKRKAEQRETGQAQTDLTSAVEHERARRASGDSIAARPRRQMEARTKQKLDSERRVTGR